MAAWTELVRAETGRQKLQRHHHPYPLFSPDRSGRFEPHSGLCLSRHDIAAMTDLLGRVDRSLKELGS
jgi:hypothetical protein